MAKVAPEGYTPGGKLARQIYFERAQELQLKTDHQFQEDPIRLAIEFVFSCPEVHTAIIGTTNARHLFSNIQIVNQSSTIASEDIQKMASTFDKLGNTWDQTS